MDDESDRVQKLRVLLQRDEATRLTILAIHGAMGVLVGGLMVVRNDAGLQVTLPVNVRLIGSFLILGGMLVHWGLISMPNMTRQGLNHYAVGRWPKLVGLITLTLSYLITGIVFTSAALQDSSAPQLYLAVVSFYLCLIIGRHASLVVQWLLSGITLNTIAEPGKAAQVFYSDRQGEIRRGNTGSLTAELVAMTEALAVMGQTGVAPKDALGRLDTYFKSKDDSGT